MKSKTLIVLCALCLGPFGSASAQENKDIHPEFRAQEHAAKYARFKRKRELFHRKADKELEIKRLLDKKAQDYEEVGQVNIKF